MVAAINQREEMIAAMGEDPSGWRAPMGYFLPGSKSANDAGMEFRNKRWSTDDVKAMLDKAGYDGGRIVLLHPTDQIAYNAFITVAANRSARSGSISTNRWRTGARSCSVAPPRTARQGRVVDVPCRRAWPEFVDPLLANTLRSNGAKAWFGWPDDPKLEAAYSSLDRCPERRRRGTGTKREFQAAAFNSVPTIPLGQYLPHAAWRSNVTGLLKGSAPVFWGVDKG